MPFVSLTTHPQTHVPESHTGQGATAAELETLTDGSDSDALHDHVIKLEAASQAEMEAATSLLVGATPGRMENHPGVCKAWGAFNQDTPAVEDTHNLTGITDTATGDSLWAIAIDLTTTTYIVVFGFDNDASTNHSFLETVARSVGSFQQFTRIAAGANDYSLTMYSVFGDH